MGTAFIDHFALLHLATGIIAYFWGVPLLWWFLLHGIFEILENTPQGMHFISNYMPIWPGGKSFKDSPSNMLGDQIIAILGWIIAYSIDPQTNTKRGKIQ